MSTTSPFVAGLLVAVLLGLAAYFAWRQVHALRSLPGIPNLSDEDRRYVRGQAWRRLACSVLMAVLAVLLSASFLFGLEDRATLLGDQPFMLGAEPSSVDATVYAFLAHHDGVTASV